MNKFELAKELKYKAIRSSGPGGQHVNKVSSKIELYFDLESSKGLNDDEKQLLLEKLDSRLTTQNILLLYCDETRSQHKNKEIVTDRFFQLITKGLKRQKKRKPTKPSRASVEQRLDKKKQTAQKKDLRKKPKL